MSRVSVATSTLSPRLSPRSTTSPTRDPTGKEFETRGPISSDDAPMRATAATTSATGTPARAREGPAPAAVGRRAGRVGTGALRAGRALRGRRQRCRRRQVLGADHHARVAAGHGSARRCERERGRGGPEPEQHPPRPAEPTERAELAEAGEQHAAEQRESTHDPTDRHGPEAEHRQHRAQRGGLGSPPTSVATVRRQRRQRRPELRGDERGEQPDPLGRDRAPIGRRRRAHRALHRPIVRRTSPERPTSVSDSGWSLPDRTEVEIRGSGADRDTRWSGGGRRWR